MTNLISDFLAIILAIGVLLMLLTAVINLLYQVPYVPTNKKVMKKMIELAHLKPGEKVYDLGCGDGRFLIEAQKQVRVDAIGFEAAPIPFLLAHLKKWLHKANIRLSMRNFFNINLHDADVIFCYLCPETMKKLGKKFQQECKPGTRIYSHTFSMAGVKPNKVWPKDRNLKLPTIYQYTL